VNRQTFPSGLSLAAEASETAASHALDDVRALLVDLDGTLVRGGAAIPGATAFVARHRDRLAIVSNNSTDTPTTLARKLAALGFDIAPGRIFLAGVLALEHLAKAHAGARVMILGSPDLTELAQRRGLRPPGGEPEVVLVARDERFDYGRLAAAANAVAAGARFYVSNADVHHPGPGAWRVPEAGSLMLAVMAVAGRSPDKVFGKPDGYLLRQALKALQASRAQAVMIGDNPSTDGLAAQDAQIRFIEVGDRAGCTVADLSFAATAHRRSGRLIRVIAAPE
jgi:HAD superfamily hydrolase (TIGR01450 family)